MPTFAEIEEVKPTGTWRFDSGSSGFGMDRRYEVEWAIQLRNNNVDWFYEPRLLLTDDRIPQYGDGYVSGTAGAPYSDPYALMRTGNINKEASNRCRIVFTLIYTTIPLGDSAANVGLNSPLADVFPTATPPTGGPSGGSGSPAGDPTQLAPKWQYGYEVIEDIFTRDLSNNLVVNTAQDPFEPAPTKPTVIRTLTTTRYEVGWRESLWDDYSFVTNQFLWRGNAGGSCLMFPPTVGDYVLLGGVLFYPVTYLVKIKIRGSLTWDLSLDSYGFNELKGGESVAVKFPATANPTKPWPLDINGAALSPAAVAAGTEPHSLRFVKYEERDFDFLQLILPTPL